MKMLVLAALLLGGCAQNYGVAGEPWTDNFNEPRDASIPGDVRKFIIQAQGCGHFAGEIGDDNDSERGRYLAKQTDKLCTGISEQREKLLKKYPRDLAVHAIIKETWDSYGFE